MALKSFIKMCKLRREGIHYNWVILEGALWHHYQRIDPSEQTGCFSDSMDSRSSSCVSWGESTFHSCRRESVKCFTLFSTSRRLEILMSSSRWIEWMVEIQITTQVDHMAMETLDLRALNSCFAFYATQQTAFVMELSSQSHFVMQPREPAI